MADIINDDTSDNPTTPQSEILSDEIISATETDTINPNQETENMEVHKHPHHVTHKKKWGEYLLEFFMLFLAVFLGFLAENVREHNVEKSKEKEYVLNIRKDLARDTSAINIWLPAYVNTINEFDSLIYMLQTPGINSRWSDLYYQARFSTRSRMYVASNNTFSELKSSGNLRLISKQSVVNALSDFQKIINSYLALSAIDKRESEMLYPSLAELFDATVFDKMVISRNNPGNLSSVDSSFVKDTLVKPQGNPQLLKHDAAAINRFIFYLHERKSSLTGEFSYLVQEKQTAAALIKLINKEYHLENE